MSHTKRILRFSLPSELPEEFASLARRLGKTKTELLREMLDVYKERQEEQELYRLQRRFSRQLNLPKPLTEKEIDRIVFEDR